MPDNVCPQCQSPNRNSARYCAECGAPLLGGLPPDGAPPAPADNAASGGEILLGRYRLDYILGRGGFGAVYKGVDLNVSRPCAIKENLDTSIEAQRQFAREATVLANLSHPNLPRVTDHFSIPSRGQYLVMDYIEGEDLAAVLERGQPVAYERAVNWAIQVAQAIEYLHEQDPPVLHRDIKPANIRITPRGKPFLVDFGLVKLFAPSTHTTLGARAITPGYAPPEQYGRGKTDVRTDIYALGATLFHLLTCKEPLESVQRVSDDSHPLAHQCNPAVPYHVSMIVARSMALDPSQRYQTAADFRQALQQALKESQSSPAEEATLIGVRPESNRSPASIQPGLGQPATPVDARQSTEPAQDLPSKPISQPRKSSQPRPASQPVRRGRSWLVTVLVIGGALACLAGLVFAGSMLSGGSAAATATAAAIQTRSAGVQATTSALEATLQARQEAQNPFPTPADLPGWPIKAQEIFSAAATGWWTGVDTSSANFDRVEANITQGVYRVLLDPKNPNATRSTQAQAFTTGDNFFLSLDSRQTSGSIDTWRGIIFRMQDKQHFYVFAIRDSGEFSLYRFEQGQWNQVEQGDISTVIRPGETNRLMVLGKQSDFTFYINGQVVSKRTLTEFSSGTAGLYFESASAEAAGFDFDNLLLRAP